MSITTNEMDDDSTVYKTLLESTKAIPWKIDWDSMQFVYIGPQIKELLGWERESWKSVDDWITRMHEDDRERVASFCVAQSKAGIDHEADYRALTSDGDYVWIRDVVHVVRRDDGSVDSLIGFMFDISERKKTEERLVDLQKELEDLSFKDGLTGVANRRMLDSILDLEWSNARRSKRPLSLILLDIDFFKEYNDCYGHLRGDDCLKLVAQTLGAAATRARDFFARFGGEEFIFVLPETDAEAAEKIAERCQELIARLEIPHQGSKVSDCLT
ncbi:GGDEF domain-containing protein, partial [Methylophaga lonarensis]|uniref:GGDEF domain-containing protein n=1 Tax=Methylophaga lonarensis TaxID=999151 RepID=UPI003D2E2E42